MPLESRQRILEFLKKSGQASVAELSKALALTPVTIRHHLETLRSEGLIAEPVARHKPGPGRPEMMYEITAAANEFMPRNYGELCGCLLEAVATTTARELDAVLVNMGSELGLKANTMGNPSSAIRFLEERGYFPRMEQDQATIVIQLANCPYLEVAKDAQVLCNFDQALIEALFGEPVEVQSRIVDHKPVCAFQITS